MEILTTTLLYLGVAIGAMLSGYRLGRRSVFISYGGIEIEAPTRVEAERLLDIVVRLKVESLGSAPAIVAHAAEFMKPLMPLLAEMPAECVNKVHDTMVQACVRTAVKLESEARRQLGSQS